MKVAQNPTDLVSADLIGTGRNQRFFFFLGGGDMTNWVGVAEKHVFIFSTCLSWCRVEAAGVLVAHVLLSKLIWKWD